ncbi:MAG TPA: hypothetical protein VJB57_01815 [Dehalococcoidia bacterium]|nr:hypothetical protein [Dehalococcoidia bacterium]
MKLQWHLDRSRPARRRTPDSKAPPERGTAQPDAGALEAAERRAEQWRELAAEAVALAKIVYADSKEAPYRRQAQSWLTRYDALYTAEASRESGGSLSATDLREQATVRDTLRQPGTGEEYD